MENKFVKIVIALGGIFQSALLVKKMAETGETDDAAFLASINSLYKIDAPDVPAVFDGINGIRCGLMEVEKFCERGNNYKNIDVARYAFSIIYLERKLSSDKTRRDNLLRRIKQAISQATYFSPIHPVVLASLASIYTDIFGTINFRIQVLGRANLLTRTDIANKVRALLLAGIRAAVLWRQVGGSRLQLIFFRRKIQLTARELLTAISTTEVQSRGNGNI